MRKLSDIDVIKHTASIHITNTVNIFQRRLWNILLANAYNDLNSEKTFTVNLRDLREVLKYKSNNYEYLKNSLTELIGCVVEWNILGKDKENKWEAFGLLASAKIEEDILTYTYATSLQKLLYNPHIYARISLSMQNKFKSKHSLALYELCLDYFISKRGFGRTPIIEIDQFRHLMGFSRNKKKPISKTNIDKYTVFKRLNEDVIKPAVKEINIKTEINIEVNYERKGRKVIGIQFLISAKNKMLDVAMKSDESIKKEHLEDISIAVQEVSKSDKSTTLIDKIVDFGLSKEIAKKIIAKKSEEEILSDVDYINNNRANKTNLSGYALTIFNDRVMPESEKLKRKNIILSLQKQDTERFLNDYESYEINELEKYKENLSESDLNKVEEQANKIVQDKLESGDLTKTKFGFQKIYHTIEINKICMAKVTILSKEEFLKEYKQRYPNAIL